MSLTPEEAEAERKRFEAWWYGLYGAKINPPTSYFQFLGNGYLSERIEWKWRTWLAAIESERERVRHPDYLWQYWHISGVKVICETSSRWRMLEPSRVIRTMGHLRRLVAALGE